LTEKNKDNNEGISKLTRITLLSLDWTDEEDEATVESRDSGIKKSDGSPGGTGAKRAQKCSVSKLDRASVIIERINVDKEKEKLRKKIQAGTSTVFKFRL
jgi:hypothetical protein